MVACEVAYSQKPAVAVPAEERDRGYRGEKARTVALMGLLAEDALKPPRRLPHVAHQEQRQGRAEPARRMLARPGGLTGLAAGAS